MNSSASVKHETKITSALVDELNLSTGANIGIAIVAIIVGGTSVMCCCVPDDVEDEDLAAGAEQGMDAQKMLDESLKVHLPLIAKDGSFVCSAKLAKKTCSKTALASSLLSMIRKVVKERVKDMRDRVKDSLDCIVWPPPIWSVVKKYYQDVILQGTMIGGAIILSEDIGGIAGELASQVNVLEGADISAVFSKQVGQNVLQAFIAHASLRQEPNTTNTTNATAIQEVVSDIAAVQSELVFWWVLILGMASGVILVWEHVWDIASELFQLVDKMEESANAAIDKMQAELPDDVHEILDANMPKAVSMTTAPLIVRQINSGIESARENLDIRDILPLPISKRSYFMLCFAFPLSIIPIALGALQYFNGPLSEDGAVTGDDAISVNETSLLHLSISHLVHAVASDDSTSSWTSNLVEFVVTDLVWSVLGSWAVIRAVSNTAISNVESHIDAFIMSHVKKNLPGGVEGIQDLLDTATGFMEGDVGSLASGCGASWGRVLSCGRGSAASEEISKLNIGTVI